MGMSKLEVPGKDIAAQAEEDLSGSPMGFYRKGPCSVINNYALTLNDGPFLVQAQARASNLPNQACTSLDCSYTVVLVHDL